MIQENKTQNNTEPNKSAKVYIELNFQNLGEGEKKKDWQQAKQPSGVDEFGEAWDTIRLCTSGEEAVGLKKHAEHAV